MSRRSPNQSSPSRAQVSVESIGDMMSQMMDKGMAMDFDITMELSSRRLRLGTLRVYGRLESASPKRK